MAKIIRFPLERRRKAGLEISHWFRGMVDGILTGIDSCFKNLDSSPGPPHKPDQKNKL